MQIYELSIVPDKIYSILENTMMEDNFEGNRAEYVIQSVFNGIINDSITHEIRFFVISNDYGVPIAFTSIWWEKDYLWLSYLYVRENYRNTKIGTIILNFIKENILTERNDIRIIRLETLISYHNVYSFYKRNGFIDIGEKPLELNEDEFLEKFHILECIV